MASKRSTYYNSLSGDTKLRYDTKIQKCGGIDPYTIKESELSKTRSDFPETSLWDIGNHLIHSVSPFTKRSFKAYKSLEAYKFFESGFVLKLGSKKNEDLAILTGTVKHSQKMNKSALKVWVLVKMDGEIICGHCRCIAGLGETCSHLGAVCFAVLSITESNENTSVTDLLCKWNVPKFKENSMGLVKDVKWTSASYEEPVQKLESSFVSYYQLVTKFSDETITDFVRNIPGGESALHTILFPNERRRKSKIKDEVFLASWYNEKYRKKTKFELIEIGMLKPLEICKTDLEEISRFTLAQRKTKFSIALTRGRVTGSNFKDCCVTDINNPSITTINRLMNPVKYLDRIPSVKYQLQNKKRAIKEYVTQELSNHENFEHQQCGLLINPKTPYFTSTSDGLVSCDCHGKGSLEIKCLKLLESSESFDVLTQKPSNILYKIGNKYYLEKSHSYFYEVQLQIHLTELNYCNFVIWSSKEMLVIRVDVDNLFWNVAKQKALTFHQEVMMPELLGKFYTVENDLDQQVNENIVEYLENEEGQSIEENDEFFELVGLEIETL